MLTSDAFEKFNCFIAGCVGFVLLLSVVCLVSRTLLRLDMRFYVVFGTGGPKV